MMGIENFSNWECRHLETDCFICSTGKYGTKEENTYKYCNHHHELTEDHKIVDFGDGEFVANVQAIPLLKALNEAGIRTRTHHMDDDDNAFIGILLDNVELDIRKVYERDADRQKYNGKYELLISWDKANKATEQG